MQRPLAIASLCWLIAMASNSVATIVVQQDGSGDATTIGEALALAADDELILLGPGTYAEHGIEVTRSVKIESIEGPATTTMDATTSDRHFLVGLDGQPIEVQIRGIRFLNGFTSMGGGSIRVHSEADVEVRECIFERNHAGHDAPTLQVRTPNTKLLIEDCDFVDNTSDFHLSTLSAIQGAECAVRRCRFYATGPGANGGLGADFSLMIVEDCLFYNLTPPAGNAIITYRGATGAFRRNTLINNRTVLATVWMNDSPTVDVRQNIIAGDETGYGLRLTGAPAMHSCNIFFGNARGPIQGGVLDISETVVDPLICDAETQDFRVATGSPALAQHNTCGVQIGALGEGCSPSTDPIVFAVEDAAAGPGGVARAIVSVSTIPQKAGSATTLGGVDFDLSWEAATAELIEVRTTTATAEWTLASNPQPGRVRVSMANLAGLPLSNRQELLILLFRMADAKPTTTSLKLENSLLFDPGGSSIPHSAEAGQLTILDCARGDVDGSGDVNSADGLRTLRIAANLLSPTPEEFCSADMTQDGIINSGDAVLVLRAAVGLEDKLASQAGAELWLRREPGRLVMDLAGAAGADIELTFEDVAPDLAEVTIDGGFVVFKQTGRTVRLAAGSVEAQPRRITLVTEKGTMMARVEGATAFGTDGAVVPLTVHADLTTPRPQYVDWVRAHPNPFNPATRVRYSVSTAGPVTLTLHDASGRVVDRLFRNEPHLPGNYAVDYQPDLSSGVYFLRLESPSTRSATKLVLLK